MKITKMCTFAKSVYETAHQHHHFRRGIGKSPANCPEKKKYRFSINRIGDKQAK
jgi:hypothetical protein